MTKTQLVREIRRIIAYWPAVKPTRFRAPAWWVARRWTTVELLAVLDDIGVDVDALWILYQERRRQRTPPTALIAALLVLAGCNIFEPPTELRVENRAGWPLTVSVWEVPATSFVPVFTDPHYEAALDNGAMRTWQVRPGIYFVEAWPAAEGTGTATVRVERGSLHRVPFYDPED